MRWWKVIVLLALAGIDVNAAVLASSEFRSAVTIDNWRVYEFFIDPTPNLPAGFPLWRSGNYISATDDYNWTAFYAPAKFLGNQSAAYGGSLSFDMRIQATDPGNQPLVRISDGTTTMQFRTDPLPIGGFSNVSIPLLASAGWLRETSGGNIAATELELQHVLSSLTFLRINADWVSSSFSDVTDLDTVTLRSPDFVVPEPGSVMLVLLGFMTVSYRRRFAD